MAWANNSTSGILSCLIACGTIVASPSIRSTDILYIKTGRSLYEYLQSLVAWITANQGAWASYSKNGQFHAVLVQAETRLSGYRYRYRYRLRAAFQGRKAHVSTIPVGCIHGIMESLGYSEAQLVW